MEKCTLCHWQCENVRKCKKIRHEKGDIDPELLEGVEFVMPDQYVFI